jgi:hypothetical protein
MSSWWRRRQRLGLLLRLCQVRRHIEHNMVMCGRSTQHTAWLLIACDHATTCDGMIGPCITRIHWPCFTHSSAHLQTARTRAICSQALLLLLHRLHHLPIPIITLAPPPPPLPPPQSTLLRHLRRR